VRRLARKADLLGLRPGRRPQGRQEGAPARARHVREAAGIKVEREVVPWSDLLDRILIATTSGQGPDVLNMGNTWTASLQATGALLPWDEKNFDKTGGRDRFVDSALAPTGAEGQDPAAVPLHSMAYALYCNKKMCSPTP